MSKLSTQVGRFAVVPEWVLDLGLPSRAIHLYAVLVRYADKDDGTAFPSRKTLAERVGCSVRALDTAVKELTEAGALTVERRKTGRTNQTNLWTIVQVCPSANFALGSAGNAPTPSARNGTENETQVERDPKNETAEHAPLPDGEKVKPRAKRSEAQRTRDLIWEALAGFFGPPKTGAERGRLGKVVSELVAAGATPPSVAAACVEMRKRGWENPSPMAVSANWTSLSAAAEARRGPRSQFDRIAEHDAAKARG